MAARKSTGICHTCWPDGWPYQAVAANCVHGDWVRNPQKPAARPAPKPEPEPEPAPEE